MPVPAHALYAIDPTYIAHRPDTLSDPVNPLMAADNVAQMYVWRQYASRSLKGGTVPLWNPYSGCGTPFLANDQSAVLHPANLGLNLACSPATARTVFVLFCLLLACLSTYGLVRSLGGSMLGGALAGVTFGLGGFMFLWLGLPLAATVAWFPALLWVTHSLARAPTTPKAVLLGLILGCQFLSGHLSSSAQILAFWVVFVSYEVLSRRGAAAPASSRVIAFSALGLVLGSLIAAPQLVPLREFVTLSPVGTYGRSRWAPDAPGEALRKGLLGDHEFMGSLAPEEAALLLVPEWRGNPAFGDYRPHPTYGNYVERAGYVGAAGLMALIAGLLWLPPRGPARFFVIGGWVVLGILLHLPALNLATYIPVLKLAAPQRLRFIFCLCCAVAVGLAAPRWVRPPESDDTTPRARRPSIWLVAAFLCALSGTLAVLAFRSLPPSLAHLTSGTAAIRVAKVFAPAAAAGALAIILTFRRRGSLGANSASIALAAVVVCDLLVFASHWHVMTARADLLPETAAVQAIRRLAGLSRISGSPEALTPNLAVSYGLHDTRIYDPISVGRFVHLAEALGGAGSDRMPKLAKSMTVPVRALDRLMSVGCYWDWNADSGMLHIRKVPSSLPRAYVTTAVRSCTGEAALRTLAAGHDPRTQALIEADTAEAARYKACLLPAKLLRHTPHRVVVEAAAPTPAWLVLTDTYYPGWRATVNDRAVPVAVANYAFRAVPVPAGASTVVFSYEPTSYRLGLFIGLLGLALMSGLTAGHLAARRSIQPRRP